MAAETKADTAIDVAEPTDDRRHRLEQAIVAEKAETARLDERVEDRRSEALTLDEEERAKAEARYREIQDKIAAQLIVMDSAGAKTPTVVAASLGDELKAMSAELDRFAARADDLEGNVRALRRLAREGPGSDVGRWRDEIGRRAEDLQPAAEAAVTRANDLRSALVRVRRMAEPRL